MALVQKRKKIKSYADVLSERMLDRIIALVEKEEKPFAYTAKGQAISTGTALKVLHKRSTEMKNGKTISHEEVKKKFGTKRA